jgi:hypothetical protein
MCKHGQLSNIGKIIFFEYVEPNEGTDVLTTHSLNICSNRNTIIDTCIS